MDEILTAVYGLLQVLITPALFTRIEIMTDKETEAVIKMDQLPFMALCAVDESVRHGPMNNMNETLFKIKLRFFWGAVTLNAARTGPGNIYQLSDKILSVLFKDKKLGGIVQGIEDNFIFKDLDVYAAFQGRYAARDLYITYKAFTRWDSDYNNQPNMNQIP